MVLLVFAPGWTQTRERQSVTHALLIRGHGRVIQSELSGLIGTFELLTRLTRTAPQEQAMLFSCTQGWRYGCCWIIGFSAEARAHGLLLGGGYLTRSPAEHRRAKAQSRLAVESGLTHAQEVCALGVGVFFCYCLDVTSVTLGYKLKLFPTRTKSDTLAALAALFQRLHTDVTTQLAVAEQPRLPSTKGLGEFIGRAYRRAYIDFQRTRKAGHTQGVLKAGSVE